jgi:hypothetical protein
LFAAYLLTPKSSSASVSGLFATEQHPAAGSNCSSATDQLNNEDHKRNDQQDMDVRANHVESNEADQPKYQQHQKNCPKHRVSPEGKVLLRCTLVRLRRGGLPYHQN